MSQIRPLPRRGPLSFAIFAPIIVLALLILPAGAVLAAGEPLHMNPCILGEKFVSVTGPDGPFVRNSVTIENPNSPPDRNPLIAFVPEENLDDLPMAFFGGTPVFYKFKITNCGTATLYNVRIDDCIDTRSVGEPGFLDGPQSCADPRLIPFSFPSNVIANELVPGASFEVTSADFDGDPFTKFPISYVDICEKFGRARIDGIVRNNSEVEADLDLNGDGKPECNNCNAIGRSDAFVFFDDLNLVQCKEKGKAAALGDRVWEDLNANGIQDCIDGGANDPNFPADGIIGNAGDAGPECDAGIPDVPVNLLAGDCETPLGLQDITDANGFYLFANRDPGDYCVEVVKPGADFCKADGFDLGEPQFTLKNAGNDDALDSDADPVDGITDPVNLSPGETDLTVDAGIYCPAKIGDRVWEDTNQDGLQEDGEPGVSGVTVRLFDCGPDGVAGTGDDVDTGESRITDAIDGFYMFGAEPEVFDLEPGDYYVKFDPTTFPADFEFTTPNVNGDDINSDCLPPDGITACVTLGSRGINLNRDCGIVAPPPNCDLELDKKCRVESPPPTAFDKCKGKLQQFTVIWDGPDGITIDSVNMGTTSASGTVNKGDEVTFFGPYSSNDVVVDISGSVNGQSTFHVSCSDDDFNSPDDCGKLAGDGKDKSGFVNLWRLEGFIDADGQVLDCTSDANGVFADNCSFTPTPAPSCQTLKDSKQKLTSLTFQYTGGGCAESDNDQGNKAVCTTTPTGATVSGSVTVRAAGNENFDKDLYTVDPTLVAPDGSFEVSADKFKSTSFIESADDSGVTETNELHTSCSQPLAVGDVFGSLTLVAINGEDGGVDVTYQYLVTNNGDPLTNVVVTDVPLGDIGGPIDLGTGDSQTFTMLAHLLGTTVNTGTASGLLANGEACSASDTVTVEAVEPPPTPAECKELKPIDALILEYDASQAGDRSIDEVAWYRDKFDPKDPTKNLINTTGPVADGEVVNFDGFAAADAKNDVDFFIQFTDGSTATSRFHRSCSDEEMNDISDCGSLQGNGKDNNAGLNTWILRDLAGNGKVLGCP